MCKIIIIKVEYKNSIHYIMDMNLFQDDDDLGDDVGDDDLDLDDDDVDISDDDDDDDDSFDEEE